MIDIPDDILPRNDQGEIICAKCGHVPRECACTGVETVIRRHFTGALRVRLEKSGRKGKMVTLIEGLPADENLLHKLTKTLKIHLGSGGTCYMKEAGGVVEIQGDHRKTVAAYLQKNSILEMA